MQGLNVRRPPRASRLVSRAAVSLAGVALVGALGFIGGLPWASGAWAQQATAESVTGRPRPEYDALGLQFDETMTIMSRVATWNRKSELTPAASDTLGSFRFDSKLELDTEYDDNIFRTERSAASDIIYRFRPQIRIGSDWANHGLSLTLGGAFGRYHEYGNEDYNDLDAKLEGKLDIDEGDVTNFSLSWNRNHEERDAIDDVDGPKPTISRTAALSVTHNHDRGEIFSRTTLSIQNIDFDDSGDVNNDDRDRWVYEARQRFGHDIDEGSQVFVEGGLSFRDYRLKLDDNGRELGSYVTEGLVGLTWDVSGVTFAEVAGGLLRQSFNDPGQGNETSFSFRGRLVWNATGLVTVTGTASREAKETTIAGGGGELKSNFGLLVDWEARYNLILSAEAGLTLSTIKSIRREDETRDLALHARWLLDNNWRLGAKIAHRVRDSNTVDESYDNTRFLLTLTEEL